MKNTKGLSEREEKIAYEAWIRGRIYANTGEKENPATEFDRVVLLCAKSANKKDSK